MSSNVTQSSLGGLPLEFQKKLIALLERLEGRIPYPYDDADGMRVGGPYGKRTISGNLTIGIGWNLEQNPIPDEIIYQMTNYMIVEVYDELSKVLPWFRTELDDARQIALFTMAYQMGVPRLLMFKKMLAAIKDQNWVAAHDEALDSKWGKMFPSRASKTAAVILTGDLKHFLR